MRPVSEWLSATKRQQQVTADTYLVWPGQGMLGRDAFGNILFQDNSGLYVAVHKEVTPRVSRAVLNDVVAAMGPGFKSYPAQLFWEDFLGPNEKLSVSAVSLRRDSSSVIGELQVGTIHKRKGVKVEPVDDSGQDPRLIAGSIDWNAKAKRRQVPNNDSHSAPFQEYFEPRYALFPRGTQLTSEQIKEIKISKDLLKGEKTMLLKLLY